MNKDKEYEMYQTGVDDVLCELDDLLDEIEGNHPDAYSVIESKFLEFITKMNLKSKNVRDVY